MTKAPSSSFGALFSEGRALAALVLAGGVGLQAMETFIGSTLLPSIVGEIGGLELFAWNSTVFVVASIFASIFAAVRPLGLGPRGTYIAAAVTFAIGSLLCALAPTMPVLLAGRAVQGFGGGLLTALSYSMIRLVFPERLWGSAFALISGVWGVSTLIGPAIGGIFASFDGWRWAFFVLAPVAGLLGLAARRVVPAQSGERGMTRFPILQILLLVGAVLSVSVASILTEGALLPALLVGLAVLAIILLGVIDRHREIHLLPTGTFTPGSVIGLLFASMLLINLAIVCDIFVPLFLQQLHGQSPLVAGYLLALVAVGWSGGSMLTSSWTGAAARGLLLAGPLLQLGANIGLALSVGIDNTAGDLLPLLPIAVALVALGAGIGISWPQISSRLLHAAPTGEGDLTSASMSMVQLFASGLGAALAGVIVNGAGLAANPGLATTIGAAHWLFGLFALVPLLAVPVVCTLVRRERVGGLTQPAE